MKRDQTLRKQCLERDEFICQKCFLDDKTGKMLEVHHIDLLSVRGDDNLDNLITLCLDCHHFAPNTKEDFDNYIKEECTGTMTTLIKAWKKATEELKKIKSPLDI